MDTYGVASVMAVVKLCALAGRASRGTDICRGWVISIPDVYGRRRTTHALRPRELDASVFGRDRHY